MTSRKKNAKRSCNSLCFETHEYGGKFRQTHYCKCLVIGCGKVKCKRYPVKIKRKEVGFILYPED